MLIPLPFLDTHFYFGPMVAQLGDISWLVGLLPGLYFLLARTSLLAMTIDRSWQA